MTQTNRPTFAAKTAQQNIFPSKEQAILLNAIDGIQTNDYIIAVGNLIGGKNILFASRIANNRICMFLSSKQVVDIIMANPSIEIEDQTITIRRLITPAHRIVMSNVCPSVPHYVLEKMFTDNNIKIVSPINFLKAGLQNSEVSHVCSFRRQVFVAPTNIILPDSILINYDNTDYRIYLSGDIIECFKCNETGHPASKCPKNIEHEANKINTETETNKKRPAEDSTEDITEGISENTTNNNEKENDTPDEATNTTTNLPNNSQETDSQPTETQKISKRKTKKLKARGPSPAPSPPIEEVLAPLKDEIVNNPEKYILSYNELKDYLENSAGSNNQLETAMEYTEDIPALVKMLNTLYPMLSERGSKHKFTRLQTKIKLQLLEEKNITIDETQTQEN